MRAEQEKFRQQVLERDGYECQYCGCGYQPNNGLHAHHIEPVSEGGAFTVENGMTLCKQHHEAVHILRDGGEDPLSLLANHDVPEDIPTNPPIDSYANLIVWDTLKDEYQVNPRWIRDVTGLKRQRVNEALGSLEDAGWIEKRTRGLYRLVYDGEGYVTMELKHKGRDR